MGTYDDRQSGRSGHRGTKRPIGGPTPIARPGLSRRSQRAVHRRRRLAAALILAVAFGLMLRALASGGTPPPPHARPAAGTGAAAHPVLPAASVEAARETAAIDRTLSYTPYVRIAGGQHREIALTFDDGPGPYTLQILTELQRAQVPATFFEIGVLERYFHSSTSAIVAAGDVIGDHTYAHAPMSHLSPTDQRAQILRDSSTIGAFGAPFPRLFRPPYGLWNGETLAALRQYRMLMVLWTVDTEDYRLPGVDAIVRSAVGGARPGAIILLHDAGGNRSETAAALPTIIQQLRARHYRLVTVPRLLADNPAPRNQHISAIAGSGG